MLARGEFIVEDTSGGPVDVDDLSLPDFHALRDAATRAGVVSGGDPGWRCRNCEALLGVTPADFPADLLIDWYADESALPDEHWVPLPPNGDVEVAFGPVQVRDAVPLWTFLESEIAPLDAAVVRGLGVLGMRAGTGEDAGVVRAPAALAERLDALDDLAWAVVGAAFLDGAYAVRASHPWFCDRCGALHDLPAPAERELDPDPAAEAWLAGEARREDDAPFPSPDAFEALVRAIGAEVYAARRVAHIDLVVERGVPAVDGSGEPLLGSYQPLHHGDAAGYTEVAFVITIYYRTFAQAHAEGSFDVAAEIRETIDHEVQHHLHYLAGHDPMDDAERVEAREELVRTFGAPAVREAERAALVGELTRIARVGLPFLAVCAVLVGVAVALGWIE